MNNQIARELLNAEIVRLKRLTWAEFAAKIKDVEVKEVKGPDGKLYCIEIEIFWDDPRRPGANIRILAAIDDGGIRALAPMTDSFILAPDGHFVGE